MDKWLETPWFIRIISLLLAVALYFSVSLDSNGEGQDERTFFSSLGNEVVTIHDVPLQVRLDEEKFVVLGAPQTVDVTIEGSKSHVTTEEKTRSFDVFIDLTGLEAGTHEVTVQHEGFYNSLKVTIDPAVVQLTLEERGTAELPVEIEYINRDTLNDEFQLGEPKISPSTVSVTGSQTEIDKIAIVKAIVDLAGVKDEIDVKAPVKVYDEQGNELNVFVSPSSVNVEIPLIVGKKELPISFETKGSLPEGLSLQGITLESETVSVYGQASILEAIEALDNLIIDLSKITEDQEIEVPVKVPAGATKVEPSAIKVSIDVEDTVEKVFENIPITVQNLPSNKEITFINPEEPEITVTIYGTSKQLESITEDDISASIDVKGFIEGEFETVITITGPENFIIKSNMETVRVRIE
jgi:YbbR domain-containing protein